ncbi:MAG: orotidine-5'-phosphate decarboxylase [Bryobacteraceae bacterium]
MQTPKIDARDRLIVALDCLTTEEARTIVGNLEGMVDFFKIGLILQMAPGAEELIRWAIGTGKKVFLDYKYYDIPETLKKAVANVGRLGVSFLTIHGTSTLIKSAVAGKGDSPLKLLTVTILTSMDATDVAELGYTQHSVEDLVLRRSRMALEAGCDGVIASGHEVKAIKEISQGRLLVVTPGIREDDAPQDDQKRRSSAGDAILAGADYLVIGRPITGKPDMRAEAERLLGKMQAAFDERAASVARE